MNYYFNERKQFTIEDYQRSKPFASFLPSIAGLDGVPLWTFYVNRGQLIAGFGVESKENAILDFVPANMAYRRTASTGFRTFVKIDGVVHELFALTNDDSVKQTMLIEANRIGLIERNVILGIQTEITYFNVSHQNYPGLVRRVTFTNLTNEEKTIELLDGLSLIWPYGTDNFMMKNMSNLAVAWFDVENQENNIPYIKNRSTTADEAAMDSVAAGNFYTSSVGNEKLPIICDPEVIFGTDFTHSTPEQFGMYSIDELLEMKQIYQNKLLCAYTAHTFTLKDTFTMNTLVGQMHSVDSLNEISKEWTNEFFATQEQYAQQLGKEISDVVDTKTNHSLFDAYIRQCFMDNLLRGGYPLVFKGKEQDHVYHVYSRIHGDMEREYNNFQIEASYFSQGNGNFRDVNQNRRNDVFFVQEAGLYNIKQFMDLIQLDGHNPLSVKGSVFYFDFNHFKDLQPFIVESSEKLEKLLKSKYTPGQLMKLLVNQPIPLTVTNQEFLELVLSYSVQEQEASFEHGYWIDHWTYNMDLIDSYLSIYPEKVTSLLLEGNYRYFESPYSVYPREYRSVLTKDDKVRQYNPVYLDEEKVEKLNLNPKGTNWSKDRFGKTVETNLLVKLAALVINKFTTLDPHGIGIMMNTDKPGWNDAMNGLPAIFGSGVSETVELVRVIEFLLQNTKAIEHELELPVELFQLLIHVNRLLVDVTDDLSYFNMMQNVRESYLDSIRLGVSGEYNRLSITEFRVMLELMLNKLNHGLTKAKALGNGILPTFLSFEAVDYTVLNHKHPKNGMQNVRVNQWEVRALPLFLEAPARYFKINSSKEEALKQHELVLQTELYDKNLKMYVTSEPLDEETLEIGRIRAFTGGWLEREAVFLHMEYKYLLGLLKSGLYSTYFENIKNCLPPYLDPSVYGRSTLENVSFIASSKNPNPNHLGRGFVARLTGTTSEMISMWMIMMAGKNSFKYTNNELSLTLQPILTGDYFDENDQVSFMFLGKTRVTYINTSHKDTFGDEAVRPCQYVVVYTNGETTTINGNQIVGNVAHDVRNGLVKEVVVTLN